MRDERALRTFQQLRQMPMWAGSAGAGAEAMKKTVWSHGAIAPRDARIASLLRVWLPVIDVLLITFGIAAVVYGAPIMAEILGTVSVAFGLLVASAALAAFAGLVFLKSKLEAVAKVALLAVLALYPFFLLFGTLSAGRVAVGVLCLVPIPILLWRVGDLGLEKGKAL